MIPLIYRDDVAETFAVKRTGRIHIPYNEIISNLCHLSKNVWNQAQHIVDGEYKEFGHVPSYEDIDVMLNKKSYYKKNPSFDNYHKLGGVTSQQVLKVHNKSWKSYLIARKDYFTNPDKDYTGIPKEPKYKKKDGEFILIFTNQQIKFRERKDGSIWMIFPKNIKDKEGKKFKIKLGNIKDDVNNYIIERLMYNKFDQVRIIPAGTGYWIEIVYDKEVIKDNSKYELDTNKIIAIDLGIENLGAITDNIGNRPIIIKGSEIKCINQWYNKRKAELQTIYDRNIIGKACLVRIDKKTNKVKKSLDKYGSNQSARADKFGRIKYLIKKTGSKMDILTDNRNKKVMDELHKFSRGIVNHALSIKAGIITIGKNPGWKQKIKIGKKNNQNFANIPFAKLIDLVRYKAEEYGITVLSPTEEHTSKCSFLDSEEICHHDKYMGQRVKRGLFKASKGTMINSDVQGSYNILVKTPIEQKTKFDNVYPKFNVFDIMEGVAVHRLVPERLSVSDLLKPTSQS